MDLDCFVKAKGHLQVYTIKRLCFSIVYGGFRAVDEAGFLDESLDPLYITHKIVLNVQ